jgi:preprotein translocase subunit Sss1
MPLRAEAVMSYIKGKKYTTYVATRQVQYDELKKYTQFLAPTNKPNRKYKKQILKIDSSVLVFVGLLFNIL